MQRGSEQVYEVLRQRLVGGHYPPGMQLKEEPLAHEFGISRTPIRAALKRLVEDGLATAAAGQGIHVARWTEADIEETFQLRMLLEPHAAGLAAARGGQPMLVKLEASNAQMAEGIARVARADSQAGIALIQDANRTFHHTLLEHAGSPRLRAMLDTMIDMPIIVRSFYLYTPAEFQQSLNHHADLTLAASARDSELARQIMKMHLRMSYHRVMRHRGEYRPPSQASA